MSDLEDNAKRAANSSMMVAEGVLSGFILMAVPLLFVGVAVGLGILLLRKPIEAIGGV
tara:strand:+ start:11150 stop:11323 length:174 start_codon:yes stop_codon:yes gene_type:complete